MDSASASIAAPASMSVQDARHLQQLRTLRVRRARAACAAAEDVLAQAGEAVRERQRKIERGRAAMKALADAVVTTLAPQMARWCQIADAERERLFDRLERDEDALISDERRLEQAQERLQEARAELTRALAREDVGQGLLRSARQHRLREIERRAELEAEDQGRRPPPAGAGR